MTIEKAKEKLKKDGYTWFELSDFDPEFYNWLSPLKCNENYNIKNYISELRVDMDSNPNIPNTAIKETFETYEDASYRKNQIVNDYKDITKFSQIWYYRDLIRIFELTNLKIEDYKKYIGNIISYFFDLEKEKKYSDLSFCTYYDIGCHLENHSDGTGTGRICAVLIYLNESYDENDGGCLILNNVEKVVPTFGKVAIIDLQSFDIKHMVTEVTNGIGRYALLSFVKPKEMEFVNY